MYNNYNGQMYNKKLREIMEKILKEFLTIFIGAMTLGLLHIKLIFNHDTKIYRCPTCNLVIWKDTNVCPRCDTKLEW